jgi:hypothetical protein
MAIAGCDGTGRERISVMLRLRNALMAGTMVTGVMGCGFNQANIAHYSIWHCDECDDFPSPAYGPGYSMMPGTYTGPPPRDTAPSNGSALAGPNAGTAPMVQPQPGPSSPPAAPTLPRPTVPGQGAEMRQPIVGPTGLATTGEKPASENLPPLPAETSGNQPAPATNQ